MLINVNKYPLTTIVNLYITGNIRLLSLANKKQFFILKKVDTDNLIFIHKN